jgi:hypothetical protein
MNVALQKSKISMPSHINVTEAIAVIKWYAPAHGKPVRKAGTQS